MNVLINRLRRAYALNNIPWDAELARLPELTLLDTAIYWEERAREYEGGKRLQDCETIGSARNHIQRLAGVCFGSSGSALAEVRHAIQYHGERRHTA